MLAVIGLDPAVAFRAKIRPSFNRACTSGPRIESRRTSPAFKSSAEMLAVAGTTMVQSTVPERSENAHFRLGRNFCGDGNGARFCGDIDRDLV